MHALWIEWQQATVQTAALLGMVQVKDRRTLPPPDAHAAFDDQFGTPRPVRRAPRQDPEERMRIIAALANAG